MCGGEVSTLGFDKDVREAGIRNGAILADKESLFIIGKSRLHSIEEATISILIAVVEVLGKLYQSKLTNTSPLVRDETNSTNLREVILKSEAVGRGGKKGLLRQITLDF